MQRNRDRFLGEQQQQQLSRRESERFACISFIAKHFSQLSMFECFKTIVFNLSLRKRKTLPLTLEENPRKIKVSRLEHETHPNSLFN